MPEIEDNCMQDLATCEKNDAPGEVERNESVSIKHR